MASVTVNLTGYFTFADTVFWLGDFNLGSTLSDSGQVQALTAVELRETSEAAGQVAFDC